MKNIIRMAIFNGAVLGIAATVVLFIASLLLPYLDGFTPRYLFFAACAGITGGALFYFVTLFVIAKELFDKKKRTNTDSAVLALAIVMLVVGVCLLPTIMTTPIPL